MTGERAFTFKKGALNGLIVVGLWLAAFAILAALVFTGNLKGLLLQVLTSGIIYAIAGLGLNLIVGHTGQLAIGHAGFFMIGGYTAALLHMVFGVNWFLAFLVGGLLAGVAGLLIGMPTLKLRGDYLAIVTLGFGQIIQSALNNLTLYVEEVSTMVDGQRVVTRHLVQALADGSAPPPEMGGIVEKIVNGASGINGIPGFARGTMGTPMTFVWSFLILALVAILLRNFMKSSHGRAITSIREDEIAAGSMGVPVFNYKLLSFVLSAVITGVAGGLFIVHNRTAVPAMFNFLTSVNFVIIIVLGGLGSNTGTILGSFLFVLSQDWLLREVIPLPNFKGLIFSGILVLVMIFFPGGLLGRKELTLFLMKKWTLGLFGKSVTNGDPPNAPDPSPTETENQEDKP